MCGIFASITNQPFSIKNNLSALSHRGPDGDGVYSDYVKNSNKYINLGHKRLSIIDLSENANQPLLSKDENYVIIFNGEIYNYKELKSKYLSDVLFKTNSDTEVILELYLKYGLECFKYLDGMFVIIIYDKQKNDFIVVRDQIGIKPLYFYTKNNDFYFSSEIKALKQIPNIDLTLSNDNICEFILNGFLYEPDTGFQHIKKIFPGSIFLLNLVNDITPNNIFYWKPSINQSHKPNHDFFNHEIKQAYQAHLVSDVPVGLFFSGGIDSTLLLSLSSSTIKPFFINNKLLDKNPDLIFANKIIKYLNRKIDIVNLENDKKSIEAIINNIKFVSEFSEELIADFTFSSSYLISKKAKEKGYKVMLSGMGADEIFLGYPRYKLIYYDKFYSLINSFFGFFLKFNKKFNKKYYRLQSYFKKKSFVLKYTNLIGYFQEEELDKLLVNFDNIYLDNYEIKLNSLLSNYDKLPKIKQAQILDLYGFLSHNFSVADKSSMLASIEMRVPLATPKLFNKSLETSTSNLISIKLQKIPLINILREKIPLKYFKRPKVGFNPDLENLINTLGHDEILKILNNTKFNQHIKSDYVTNLLCSHFSKKVNNTYKIYQLLYLNYWLDYNK